MAETQSSIVIVDDDPEDLASVEKALRPLGCELYTVRDPHGVMYAVQRYRPSVVVLDALLPGLSGFDLCKQIKTDPQLKGIAVVILTGVYLRQQYRQDAIQQFKADGFMTKPFRPPELQRLVAQFLSRRGRNASSGFLRRIGLPVSTEPRKRTIFGRIFGGGVEEDVDGELVVPAPPEISIAPKRPPAPPAAETVAPSLVALEPPVESVGEPIPTPLETKAPTEPLLVKQLPLPALEQEVVPLPVVDPVVENPPPEAATPPAPLVLPQLSETLEDAEPPAEPLSKPAKTTKAGKTPRAPRPSRSARPGKAAKPAPPVPEEAEAPRPPEPEPERSAIMVELSPVEELEAVPAEEQPVLWIEYTPSPPEPPAEEIPIQPIQPQESEPAPLVIEVPPPSSLEAPEAAAPSPPENPVRDEAPAPMEADAPAQPPETKPEPAPVPEDAEALPVRRRRLRAGDVPIYDEEDFGAELRRELSKCRRVDRPLTLILIRVDDLGEIIELFGKDFREPVLWHVAEQAMASLREVDLVGMMTSKSLVAMTAFASDRYGGGRIVTRMREAVAKRPFRVGEELPPIVPALHFGMATFPQDGTEAASLIETAERELKAAER
jgi:diguanylate cyclase (GGDEF)-like protein